MLSRKFPDMVFKSPGAHAGPPVRGQSTTFDFKQVDNDDEFAAAIVAGWWPTQIEAVDPEARDLPTATVTLDEALDEAEAPALERLAAADAASPTGNVADDLVPEPTPTPSASAAIDLQSLSREDLKAMLKTLDVDFDGRASKETLIDLVVAAQKAG